MHITQYYHTSQHKYTKICQIIWPTVQLFYLEPPSGVTPSEFLHVLWQQKTLITGLIVRRCLHNGMFSRLVTDRHAGTRP